MFGWLANALRNLTGSGVAASASSVQNALNTIAATFRTVYTYWHTVAGHVISGWKNLTSACLGLLTRMSEFMFAQWAFDVYVVKHLIPWLANWIAWLGARVKYEIAVAVTMLRREYKAGDSAQHAYTRSVWLWVIVHVLGFLYNLLRRVFAWIDGIGAKMWYYFTHLDRFAELLFDFLVAVLEARAWDVAGKLGRFFLALIVRNVVRFAILVEDIISAVL